MTAAKSTVNRNSAPGSLKSQNPFVQYIKRTKCTYRIGAMKRNFFSVPVSKIFVVPLFHPQKGIFPLFQQKNFCYKRPPHYNGYYFFFFTSSPYIHCCLQRPLSSVSKVVHGLKRFGNCVPLLHPKRPTRKIFPLFPMVLFLFSPRELIKRPSLGRLNKYLGQTLTNHQQVK